MKPPLVKLFLYYFDNELYGFTGDKNIAKSFEMQRNMNKIVKKKIAVTEPEFQSFSYMNRNKQFYDNVLHDGKDYIQFVTTYAEDNIITEYLEKKENEIQYLRKFLLSEINLKKKYRKLIDEALTYTLYDKYQSENYFELDMFSIFCKLFKDTIF